MKIDCIEGRIIYLNEPVYGMTIKESIIICKEGTSIMNSVFHECIVKSRVPKIEMSFWERVKFVFTGRCSKNE